MTTATDIERVLWSPPTHAVIAWGDVLLQLWEREAPASAFHRIHDWCSARARTAPDRPLFMIAVVSTESRMPDAEARAVSAKFPEFFTEFALVIEGTGFRAAAVRAVLASMSMLSSRRTRPHTVATVEEACETLGRLSRGAVDTAELERTVRRVRADLRAR